MARTCHHPQQCHPQQRLCAVRCCASKANLICRKSNINQKISKINLLTKTHHVKANWWIDSDVIHFVTISLHFFFCTTIILYPKEWQISASIARLSQYIGQYIFAMQKKRNKMRAQLWHVPFRLQTNKTRTFLLTIPCTSGLKWKKTARNMKKMR